MIDAPVPDGLVFSPEQTTTVVIGTGFSALAMAAELNRQGVKTVVVGGSCSMKQHSPLQPATGGISLADLSERSEVVRLLEHYARRHHLDIRPETHALELSRAHGPLPVRRQWQIHTAHGILSADSVIFTRSALSQLLRVLHDAGVTTAAGMRAGMDSLGLYLVGVSEQAVPTTQDILHQVQRAGQAISARVSGHTPSSAQLAG